MLTHCKLILLLVFHQISPQNTYSSLCDLQLHVHGKIQPCLTRIKNGGVINAFYF